MLNFFRDMRSNFFKWNKYVIISIFFWLYFSFFLKNNSSTIDIKKIRTQFNSIFMKFSMFNLLIVFFRFFSVKNRLNKSSTTACFFFFEMCLTSKSNNLIQVIYFVINASNKSIFNLFNCVINISAFVFNTKCTSYNQYRIFSVFSVRFDIFVWLHRILFQQKIIYHFHIKKMTFFVFILHKYTVSIR